MWYYSENNQQLGPVSEDDLKQKARSGGLKPTTLVWKDGMSDWKPIADLPELAISMQNHSAPVATSTVPGPPAALVNPYASPQSGTVQSPAMQMSSPAPYINSGGILAFAIVSTIMCCPPFGIPGIVYAAKINGQLAAGDLMGAQESARKSKMWSWIGIGGWLLFFLIYILAIIFGVTTGVID